MPRIPDLRNLGLAPKPFHVKQKTINQLDTYLHSGAAGNEGRVALFEPTMPARDQVPSELYDKVQARYSKRKKEWDEYIEGDPKLEIPPYQLPENTDLDGILLVDKDPKSRWFGRHFTGDHDLFDIIDPTTGKPLGADPLDVAGKARAQQIIKRLQRVNSGQPPDVMHGEHVSASWGMDRSSREGQKAYEAKQGIMYGHTPLGGDPLVAFTSTGQVMESRYYPYSQNLDGSWNTRIAMDE